MKQFLLDIFTWKGRWNRQKFWLYPLFISLITVIPFILSSVITWIDAVNAIDFGSNHDMLVGPVTPIQTNPIIDTISIILGLVMIPLFFLLMYVSILAYVKRLRDLDKNPLMILLLFVPFASIYLWVICAFFKGTQGPNRYGPDPLGGISVTQKKQETVEL